MTELEELKKQEHECKLQMSNLLYYGSMCRAKFDEWHDKYKKVKDSLAVLEVEERVNRVEGCLNCGNISYPGKVIFITDDKKCSKCGAKMIETSMGKMAGAEFNICLPIGCIIGNQRKDWKRPAPKGNCPKCGGQCSPECGKHPKGCIYGGPTEDTAYWLIADGCELYHG